ncbi:MAG: ubiquitin-like small modifier protein 1 [Planctomycetota bacterium]|jgi:molybdopterin synthase sulfur carrier subunit
MNVNFYATLRQVTGRKSVEFALPAGATVQVLLDAVLERFPEMTAYLLDDQGRLYPHVHIFINGRDAPYLDRALETPLTQDDAVDFFPAVGGG